MRSAECGIKRSPVFLIPQSALRTRPRHCSCPPFGRECRIRAPCLTCALIPEAHALRRLSPRKSGPALRPARLVLASLLACALLAGAAPFGLAADAHGCEMPCCKGAGGDCADGSCAVELPSKTEAPTPAPESDPVCGADSAAARHASGRPPARHAPPAPVAREKAGVAHRHRRHVSGRDTSPGAKSAAAAVSEPCPPDCGAAPNSFNSPRRPREHAALTHRPRPRAPTHAPNARPCGFVTRLASTRRGPCPPRAPPADADSSV